MPGQTWMGQELFAFSGHFANRIFQMLDENVELRIVFDRYDVSFYVKKGTRTTMLGEQNAV